MVLVEMGVMLVKVVVSKTVAIGLEVVGAAEARGALDFMH